MKSPWDIEDYLFPQIVSSLLTILCCFKIVNKLLTKHYNLHDSYITSTEYSADSRHLCLQIDFAFWMQESYKDGEPENGVIRVVFRDVDQYLCVGGNPTGAFVGILGSEYSDGLLIIKLLDDETNEYFEMQIKANFVDVTTL